MKAIRLHRFGGPEVLTHEDVPVPSPRADEALVKIAAIGVNFVEIYNRIGLYKMPLPAILGSEASGLVEAVGGEVTTVRPGDRVAFAQGPGAYAEYAAVPAGRLVVVPPRLSHEQAAAVMLQGATAHYLVRSTFQLQAGQTCLIHAAAGGVGLLLVQMARRAGARVLATVSTAAKAELARQAGAEEVILYGELDFAEEVKRLTGGRGVDVVYDSVGRTTYQKSLNCLRPRGCAVFFGQSSGPVPPLDPLQLSALGSLYLTRPSLAHYLATREELLWRAGEVFAAVASGELKLRIDRVLPLARAAEAHRLLESRATAGKLLLQP